MSEFGTGQKVQSVIIQEGQKRIIWKELLWAIHSLVKECSKVEVPKEKVLNKVPVRRGRSLHRTFASVVKGRGQRREEGRSPVGRWERVVVCEHESVQTDWDEVGKATVRLLGKKGMLPITPFMATKGVLFVAKVEVGELLQ